MESIICEWDGMGILRQLTKSKLVFIETKDVVETTLALDNYRRACDSGRGAVFLSVARGKVSGFVDPVIVTTRVSNTTALLSFRSQRESTSIDTTGVPSSCLECHSNTHYHTSCVRDLNSYKHTTKSGNKTFLTLMLSVKHPNA